MRYLIYPLLIKVKDIFVIIVIPNLFRNRKVIATQNDFRVTILKSICKRVLKDMELNKRYIIDLSQAQTPADIVFELSNIIEKPEAANQKIWLKLGSIALNQSQLLSINSLISSINSTLSLIESESQQTELAAATLGISTRDVEEELQEELSSLEAEAPKDEPSEQYIAITDHIDEQKKSEKDTNESENAKEDQSESEEKSAEPVTAQEENDADTIEKLESVFENTNSENKEEDAESNYPTAPVEAMSEEKEEEIQNQLDSIFDSEAKLENILNEEKELQDMQNWPLTKEAEDNFEIPDEEMTDEDYEILQMNTRYHKQTVRSGQVIKSNGNVVIIGDCHAGCEIHAAGDITVWGILGGIAHAGCNGNTKARIRALNLNAIQLRIADSYARRPDHIKNIYVEKSNSFTPEEARNINGSIVILKIND